MKFRRVRIAARALLVATAVIQLITIAGALNNFDPNVSCDRLLYWGEWLDCMHGRSHAYVWTIELVLFSWIIAAIAALAGRRLPPYVSAAVPGGIAAVIGLFLRDYWRETVVSYAPFGQTTIWDALNFMQVAVPMVLSYTGPAAGAWLLAIYRRYKPPEVAGVFD